MEVWEIINLGDEFWAECVVLFSLESPFCAGRSSQKHQNLRERATDPSQSYWELVEDACIFTQTSWKFLECGSSGEVGWRHPRQEISISRPSCWHQRNVSQTWCILGDSPSHGPQPGRPPLTTEGLVMGSRGGEDRTPEEETPTNARERQQRLWGALSQILSLKRGLFSVTAICLPQEWNHFRPAAAVLRYIFWWPQRAHWE